VDVGEGSPRQIICGAKNIQEGQKVPVALPGAILPGDFVISERKMRGVMSCGMLCSGKEIGLSEDGQGILILSEQSKIGQPLSKSLCLEDTILDIDNTALTNRPDLFSHFGFAREFVALGLGEWNKDSVQKIFPSERKEKISETDFPVTFIHKQKGICPVRYNVFLSGIHIKESPEWMQRRLKNCGIRPINNIVDISNYVMLEIGMPLHIFDRASLTGNTITIRESENKEQVTTLDDICRTLPTGVILQEDSEKVFDLAGIMGGKNSEITESTTEILVHVPIYDPIQIRQASLSLGHRTDASTIYEKTVPRETAEKGIFRVIDLICTLLPEARVVSDILRYEEECISEKEERKITVSQKMISRILGGTVSSQEIKNILESLEFSYDIEDGAYKVGVPRHRYKDIQIAEDIVEEIARIHGFNTISTQSPKIQMRPSSLSPLKNFHRDISDFLVGQGFFEVVTFSFLGPELLRMCGMPFDESSISIDNPISSDQSLMRQSLLPRLFETAERNRKKRSEFSLFEIGKVFFREGSEKKKEKVLLTALSCEKDFFALREIVQALCNALHISLHFRPLIPKEKKEARDAVHFLGQKGASIFINDIAMGNIGIPNQDIREKFSLPENSSFFSLDISELSTLPKKNTLVLPVSKFPEIELDLSVLADKNTISADIAQVAKNIDPLITSVDVLEIFEGDTIPEGKKSVTLHFVFQAFDRTLETADEDKLREKIVKTLTKKGFPFRFSDK
jgi:phenylalanyl-tRNA synthetase beta chain